MSWRDGKDYLELKIEGTDSASLTLSPYEWVIFIVSVDVTLRTAARPAVRWNRHDTLSHSLAMFGIFCIIIDSFTTKKKNTNHHCDYRIWPHKIVFAPRGTVAPRSTKVSLSSTPTVCLPAATAD